MKKTFIGVAVMTLLALSILTFGQKGHAKITPAQAQKAALAKYPGKVVGKIELENEEGTWQYAVVVKTKKKMYEVMVDANTGKIANVEVVTAAGEAKEKAAEAHARHKKGSG